jgi:nucleoside-diphosphate-sugar epimerase
MSRVLVTGASGYIALHVVDLLLKQGHKVRGTVRNLKDEHKIAPIKKLNTSSSAASSMLELVEAELLNGDSLKKAVQDTDYVIHIASPLPITNPVDENEVIKPALEGTLNVLQAAFNAKTVKRVIVTSSGLAIAGYKWEEKNYTEQDWPNPDAMPMAYGKMIYI